MSKVNTSLVVETKLNLDGSGLKESIRSQIAELVSLALQTTGVGIEVKHEDLELQSVALKAQEPSSEPSHKVSGLTPRVHNNLTEILVNADVNLFDDIEALVQHSFIMGLEHNAK